MSKYPQIVPAIDRACEAKPIFEPIVWLDFTLIFNDISS